MRVEQAQVAVRLRQAKATGVARRALHVESPKEIVGMLQHSGFAEQHCCSHIFDVNRTLFCAVGFA